MKPLTPLPVRLLLLETPLPLLLARLRTLLLVPLLRPLLTPLQRLAKLPTRLLLPLKRLVTLLPRLATLLPRLAKPSRSKLSADHSADSKGRPIRRAALLLCNKVFVSFAGKPDHRAHATVGRKPLHGAPKLFSCNLLGYSIHAVSQRGAHPFKALLSEDLHLCVRS